MSTLNWNSRRSDDGANHAKANRLPRPGHPVKGYFVFPPGGCSANERVENSEERTPQPCTADMDSAEKDRQAKERAWEEARQQKEAERRRRLEIEREAALHGEIDWVRSGGILRDATGKRDYARTESIRSELRLQKEEQLVAARWAAYEDAWRRLLASADAVAFSDIPWPVERAPAAADGLSPGAIADFLLAPLRVRANAVTRKERIRASFLRWHPDKIASVLNRVVEEDAGAVREGISAVLMCLKTLQAAC